jgi:hypothetical protein
MRFAYGAVMQRAHRCLVQSDFRALDGAPKMGAMDATPVAIRLSADLRLRGHGGPIPVRVRWPASPVLGSPPPVVVVLADPSGTAAAAADGVLCDELCAGLGALVLSAAWSGPRDETPDSALERAASALEWAADHAVELDGDPRRVLVAGRDRAAAAASGLALRARDHGWPQLVGQVLVITRPCRGDREVTPAPTALSPPADATIVTPLAGSRCSHRLRAEGARVTELIDARVDPGTYPEQPFLPALTDILRRALA